MLDALPAWTRSLQFRLTFGFVLILAGTLATVGSFVMASAERQTESFRQDVGEARAERVERLVQEAYQNSEGWDAVQEALEKVSALYDWRVLVVRSDGLIVGDSHHQYTLEPMTTTRFARHPLIVNGQHVATFLIEAPQWSFSSPSQGGVSPGEMVLPPGGDGDALRQLLQQRGSAAAAQRETAPLPEAVGAEEPAVTELAASFNQSLLWSGLAAGALGVILVAFTTRRALKPVYDLRSAAGAVASGDLSQRVDAEPGSEVGDLGAAFNHMAASLQDAETERRRMVADIAHELRSPLTNIQGYLEAIRDGVLQPDEATIDTIYSQTRHLGTLVEDLQLLALMDSGHLGLYMAHDELPEVVRDAASAFSPRAAEQGVTLDLRTDADMPEVWMDSRRVRQVVANLVENALRHTPEGGRVTVETTSAGSNALIRVSDTGPGIPPENLPHIFDRFYRVDPSRQRSTGGAGLGLTIVKRLAELHGGGVSVDSVPGDGAVFTVSLPINGSKEASA